MSRPPWWHPRKEQNRQSKVQEQKRAAEVGGRRQAGSGSSWRAPQDVVAPEHLEQMKFTATDRFTLLLGELLAMDKDARNMGRDPKMIIDFNMARKRAIVTLEDMP